jgi:hypothetical protein
VLRLARRQHLSRLASSESDTRARSRSRYRVVAAACGIARPRPRSSCADPRSRNVEPRGATDAPRAAMERVRLSVNARPTSSRTLQWAPHDGSSERSGVRSRDSGKPTSASDSVRGLFSARPRGNR